MSTSSQIFSFIFLVLITTSFTTTLTLGNNHIEDGQNHLATVQITNSLPNNNSRPTILRIRCSSKHTNLGEKVLNRSDDYRWIVEEKSLYFCAALWGRLFASWHAFQPKRDAGHDSVFWLVEEGGIYLSWDNSSWVRRSVWESE